MKICSFQPNAPDFNIHVDLFKLNKYVLLLSTEFPRCNLEVLKGKNVWNYLFFVQFVRVRIVVESWDFKEPVSRNTDTVFHFRNHVTVMSSIPCLDTHFL